MSTSGPQGTDAKPILVVLSGPSGVGKDAVLVRMRELGTACHFAVTATTRTPRSSERHGVDYSFLTRRAFTEMIDRGELLEWAEVYEHLYGVPTSQVVDFLRRGCDVVVKTDVQGAATIKKLAPKALFIFVAPSNMDELERRLSQRMTESADALKLRLETAAREMEEATWFDHVVVNRQDRLDEIAEKIGSIIEAERRRTPPRNVQL